MQAYVQPQIIIAFHHVYYDITLFNLDLFFF